MSSKTLISKESQNNSTDMNSDTETLETCRANKYRAIQIVALVLLGVPTVVLILYFLLFTVIVPIFYRMIPYTTGASLLLCVYNGVNYQSHSVNSVDRKERNHLFVFHSLLYIDLFMMIVVLFSISIQSMNGNPWVFLMISLYPITFLLKYPIVVMNGFRFPNDRLSKIYLTVFSGLILLFTILQIIIFFPDPFLQMGIDIFLICDLLIRIKVLYEIGPIVISYMFFARRVYDSNH